MMKLGIKLREEDTMEIAMHNRQYCPACLVGKESSRCK